MRPALHQQILSLLREPEPPDPRGNVVAWCPFHPDGEGKPPHRKSLSVHPERGFFCHACGAGGSLRKLGEHLGIPPEPGGGGGRRNGKPSRPSTPPPGPSPERNASSKATGSDIYDYRDEEGRLLFQVIRRPGSEGGKDFRQRCPDGRGGWRWRLGGVKRVPYRLPELLEADSDQLVFIPEGEKDVDRLRSLGLVATTNPGGAGKWGRMDAEVTRTAFRDRNVVILPDNDDPGRKHAAMVARALLDVCSSVRILELEQLPHRGDVSDWLDGGGTAERLHELAAAVTPLGAEEVSVQESRNPGLRRDDPAADAQSRSSYESTDDGVIWHRPTREGRVPVRLSNWTARITAEVLQDDGEASDRAFELEARLGSRESRFAIPAASFDAMGWVRDHLGAAAVTFPAPSARDHLRCAIQLGSGEVPERVIHGHTGWGRIQGKWCYLHAGGAIGESGVVPDVEVALPEQLSRYVLPTPVEGEELVRDVRRSLNFLETAPDSITLPLEGMKWRAVCGPADYSVHLTGRTGAGKSVLAALVLQALGPEMDSRGLPASWTSTANALEALAFTLKDNLLVVDDFCPAGGAQDIQRLHAGADRLLRAQGNCAGRARLTSEAALRRTYWPRGTILSTGEDVPRGQSLRSRMLILELAPSDLRWDIVTECQVAAAEGAQARVLSSFLRWLAPRYDSLQEDLASELVKLRREACASAAHRRTPEIAASIHSGLRLFVEFAREAGAVGSMEGPELLARAWAAMGTAMRCQGGHQRDADPVDRFLDLLSSALSSGRAHMVALDGGPPPKAESWGWTRTDTDRSAASEADPATWQPRGIRIGWLQGEDLYLEKGASFSVAQQLAREQGDPLPVGARTLRKRLHDRGILRTVDGTRGTATVRITAEGARRDVLHMLAEAVVKV